MRIQLEQAERLDSNCRPLLRNGPVEKTSGKEKKESKPSNLGEKKEEANSYVLAAKEKKKKRKLQKNKDEIVRFSKNPKTRNTIDLG